MLWPQYCTVSTLIVYKVGAFHGKMPYGTIIQIKPNLI